ncbi:hypothetical protein [Streptomyces thioluteus]
MLAELFIAFPEVQRYLRSGHEWRGHPSSRRPPSTPAVADGQRAR